MSNSYKKHPSGKFNRSDKYWKRLSHKIERQRVKKGIKNNIPILYTSSCKDKSMFLSPDMFNNRYSFWNNEDDRYYRK